VNVAKAVVAKGKPFCCFPFDAITAVLLR